MADLARALLERFNSGVEPPQGKFEGLTDDFVRSASDLADRAYLHWKNRAKSNYDRERRRMLSELARKFHSQAGTLTPEIEQASVLAAEDSLLLRVAHQPNVFPYMGVVSQFLFIYSTAEILAKRYDIPTVALYLIVDYDTAGDSRFRTAHFPATNKSDSTIDISVHVPKDSFNKPMFSLPRPPEELVSKWFERIESAARHDLIYLRRSGVLLKNMNAFVNNIHNTESMVWKAYDRSHSLTDFNSFFMSVLVNQEWDLPIIFVRESDFRMNRFPIVSRDSLQALAKAEFESLSYLESKGVETHYQRHPSRFPYWYFCEKCNERCSLEYSDSPDALALECKECGQRRSFELDKLMESSFEGKRFAPNVLLDDLLDTIDLSVSGGSTYIGGAEHTLVSNLVAERVGVPVFPQAVWRPWSAGLGTAELVISSMVEQGITENYQQMVDLVHDIDRGRATVLYHLFNSDSATILESWLGFLKDHSFRDMNFDVKLCPASANESLVARLKKICQEA